MSYPSVLIALDSILIAAPEATIIDELRQFLLDELLDLGYGLLETLLVLTGHMEIEWRVLHNQLSLYPRMMARLTVAVAKLLTG